MGRRLLKHTTSNLQRSLQGVNWKESPNLTHYDIIKKSLD